MLTAQAILHALDYSNDGYYHSFVALGHPYSYLIDSRLNLFRAEEQWAVVVERLGYAPRGGSIELELFYYGNCLRNLPEYNNRTTNVQAGTPIDWEAQQALLTDELLDPAAKTILIRDTLVPLTHDPAAYAQAGIELVEYEPGGISLHEVGRLLIQKHAHLLRATDSELYQSLPAHLRKIMVLDEWYHRDFDQRAPIELSDESLAATYQLSQASLAAAGIDQAGLAALVQVQQARQAQQNRAEWEQNRPSSYETWQQLAQVLATGDVHHYQPTLPATTHWRHWPESGSL
ncbi:hypothetical protein HHL22_01680 [Hymenobacter sp. RP-2-7]|uniref:Uncharacterized protein n=1 Tax=Hymenobacter polaris TaxID=2682546 RepID=A0A7Y0AB82_9BACT|nr:hypothetical protein [Hymenobacter polaris]NML63905.1 hypothetical protein [Hymenobacter polaris]